LPVVVGDVLVVPTQESAVLAAYDLDLTKELWTLATKEEWGSPRMTSLGGVLIAGNATGQVVAIRPSDGSVRWTQEIGGTVRGVRAVDGMIFAGNTRGQLVAIAAKHDGSRAPARVVK